MTDHRWRHHPTALGPTCVPCGYNSSQWGEEDKALYPPIPGCPCTPKVGKLSRQIGSPCRQPAQACS